MALKMEKAISSDVTQGLSFEREKAALASNESFNVIESTG
jgi:hypothetical protein